MSAGTFLFSQLIYRTQRLPVHYLLRNEKLAFCSPMPCSCIKNYQSLNVTSLISQTEPRTMIKTNTNLREKKHVYYSMIQ
jgi:hypothetical protein